MTDPVSPPVFISREATLAVFRWEEAIRALQAAYGRRIDDSAVPPRTAAKGENAWLRSLTAVPAGTRYYGAKLMGLSGGDEDHGLEYVVVLFDRQTHRIAAFLDANVITGLRTAATSAAALDRLSAPGPARLAVLGSGFEATTHTRAITAVRPLSEVLVFSPTPQNREAFARRFTDELGVPVRAVDSPEKAANGADIVVSAAVARSGNLILHGKWLKPGACVISIGSVMPQARELDVSVVEKCDFIVCDMRDEVLRQTGDMIAAKAAGVDVEAKSYSLNALLTGEIDEQRRAARQPMFKSVGGGFQDVVVSEMILTQALQAGVATPLPMEFETKGPAGKARKRA